MKLFSKNKLTIWLSLATSLFGVCVAAVSTAAWFQINTTSEEVTNNNTVKSGSANLNIGNIYGHKIVPELSASTGYTDYSNSTVTKMSGNMTIESTNIHQDDEDIAFDVPSQGIGYYLIKRNAAGNFKYGSSTVYKFTEYDVGTMAYCDITSSPGDVYRVKKYTFANNETVNTQYIVSTSGGSSSIDNDTKDIVNLTADDYRVWLDYSTDSVVFDNKTPDLDMSGSSLRSIPKKEKETEKTNKKITTRASKPSTVTTIGLKLDSGIWGQAAAYYSCQIWNSSTSKGDTYHYDFEGGNQVTAGTKVIYCDVSAFVSAKGAFTHIVIHRWGGANRTSWWNKWSYYSDGGDGESNNSFSANAYNYFVNDGWSSCSSNKDYNPGYYLFGAWGGVAGKYNIDNAIASDATPVSGNVASWSSVSFTSSDYFKVGYYNMGGGITYQNNGLEGQHSGFNWTTPYASNNIYCSSTPSGTYKVFLMNTSYKVAINKDVTISCYKILGSASAAPLGDITGNTDILLSSTSGFSDKFPAITHYTLDSYYSDSSKNTRITPGSYYPTADMEVYCYYQPDSHTITLMASFWIKTSPASAPVRLTDKAAQVITTVNKDYGSTYTALTTKQANKTDTDTVNGVYYVFEQWQEDDTYKWYTDETCGTQFTSGTVTGDTAYYAKYVATVYNYKTIFIDSKLTSYPNSWSTVKLYGTNNSLIMPAVSLGGTLYRVTIPAGTYRFGNASISFNHDRTGNVTVSDKEYMQIIGSNQGEEHGCSQGTGKFVNIGTATIMVNGVSSGETMDIGDLSSNYFVYEKGLQIASGKTVSVQVTVSAEQANASYYASAGTYNYKWAQYNGSKPCYVEQSDTEILLTNFDGNARFNFYIYKEAGNLYISIAMVPDLGNGYYIMQYDEDLGTNNFINGIKMATSSDYTASYSGYHANLNDKIFIRSYVNTVDKPCINLTDNTTGRICRINDGVITFTSPGYYNIDVTGNRVTISDYEVSDFFKLNPIVKSNATSPELVKGQKTALCLEVEFTCDNAYESTISADVSNGIVHNSTKYVCACLYITKEFETAKSYAVGEACFYNGVLYKFTTAHTAGSWNAGHVTATDPYDFMRDNYYGSLSTANTINDLHTGFYVSANDNSTYHAFIFIDYMYGDASYWNNYPGSGNIEFALRSTQR